MDLNEEIFLKHLAPTSTSPYLIQVDKAEGIYIYSTNGKRYTDLISGIGVTNIGHRHPHVIDAIRRQIDKHLHVMVYGEFVQQASSQLVSTLVKHLPESLDCVYLVNSGTEANEGALKLAKRYTGRTEIISCRKSYHGSTHGSLSVSGNEMKKNAFRPLLPDVAFIDFNKPEDLSAITERTACVIMETIQGDAGVRIPDASYLKEVRKRCDETGALLILDEIQCGMGRTGSLFAFQKFGVVPDILTVGKAFGGGLPIAAFIASNALMQSFTSNPMLGHITTFGGNPVCCASALATLEILTDGNLISDVERKGQLFESLLKHPLIKDVRRSGMMFAIDFESADLVNRIVLNAKELGVICYWFLSLPNSFRIAPPLTISDDEIKESCEVILKAIGNS
jgi:acetylornithine/succinyldiaminopimelate/putrescine aminotransferase